VPPTGRGGPGGRRPPVPEAPGLPRRVGTVDYLGLAVAEVEDDRLYEQRTLGGAAPGARWRHVDLAGCALESVALAGSELTACSWVDVEADTCDLQGIVAERLRTSRLRLAGCRMSGATVITGDIRDTTFEALRGPDIAIRASQLRRVAFVGCALTGLDLADSELVEVAFTRCDLTGARFPGTRLRSVHFLDCDLTAISGVDGLAGASLDEATLTSAAASLARGLGIDLTPA
jgi:uncharacterized protein YjbI with pentapeptide repeats